jgi:hypothetical protein
MSGVDYNGGTTAWGTSVGVNAYSSAANIDHPSTNDDSCTTLAAGCVYAKADSVNVNESGSPAAANTTNAMGSYMTNSCLSAMSEYYTADTTARIQVYGFTGNPQNCVDFAVDGFSVFGMPIIYRIDSDMTLTTINNNAATTVAIDYAILKDLKPLN